jgi:ubiquinone/menaquinone biosynthesis C-methylase UbiE
MVVGGCDLDLADKSEVKTCCSNFYENELVANFFGGSFHPGGEELTLHLGRTLGITKDHKVLDIACGSGTSALTLAKEFGCRVVGIDLSEKNLEKAKAIAKEEDLEDLLDFKYSDAEKIDLPSESFDFVICECALCTFPDTETAVKEMYRVLKVGGKVGITDVVMERELPDSLKNIVSMVLCIAGAKSKEGYEGVLGEGGFINIEHEDHSDTIEELLEKAKKLVAGWDILNKITDSGVDKIFDITPEKAKELLEVGFSELEKETFGYGMFSGSK